MLSLWKMLELENKLKQETKLMNKAEKRLNLLKKKLESLKILPDLEESERSSSSQSSAISSVSSASSSGTKHPQESASEIPEIVKENASDTKSDTKESSYEKSSNKSSSSHEVPQIEHTSSSSLEPSSVEINTMNYKDDNDEYVDNSLALVPLELPEMKPAPEIHIVSKSVGEVLDSLRHARERIQSSMGRRQMIRVGPS
ncbi:suppressor protein SRP40-like isoform X2 [Hibiscus syriacus]|uniref:suppressor protein SRP40-like isoform X2 n=1 Tax=Hibiscus syriacus TaxID=106335 RepID=UPI0019221F47|nr:suppressor protein SRP40-like isoform X2 [Hibiscus syriacus]